jgi:hypothetical protein
MPLQIGRWWPPPGLLCGERGEGRRPGQLEPRYEILRCTDWQVSDLVAKGIVKYAIVTIKIVERIPPLPRMACSRRFALGSSSCPYDGLAGLVDRVHPVPRGILCRLSGPCFKILP